MTHDTTTHSNERDVSERSTARGRVDYVGHDLEIARDRIDGFDELTDSEKIAALEDLPEATIAEASQPNTTCTGLDQGRVISVDWSDGTTDAGRWVAVGTGTTTPDYEDTELTAEVDRATIADYQPTGDNLTTIIFNAFLDENQGNAEDDLSEVGVISTSGLLYNHSLITPFEKNNQRGLTVRVTLTFEPATV